MQQFQKMDRKNVQNVLALSPVQEGLLFQYLVNPDSDQYCEQLSITLAGVISFPAVQEAWNRVVATNEMLRTVFAWENLEKPVQIILKDLQLPIKLVDLTQQQESGPNGQTTTAGSDTPLTNAIEPADSSKALVAWQTLDKQVKFDLATGPLFRVQVGKVGEFRYVMLISNHHIIFDGWSTGIILKEFFAHYHALCQGESLQLRQKTSYKTYIQWLQEQNVLQSKEYWRTYLHGFSERTALPFDVAKQQEIMRAEHFTAHLPAELWGRVQSLVQEWKITLSALLYTAWGIVLQKYNSTLDVVFGTTVSGRPALLTGVEEMVGLFINTIPLRVTTQENEPVRILSQRVHRELQERQSFAWTALAEITACSEIDTGGPLFDSIIVVENYPLEETLPAGLELRLEGVQMTELTNFDLTIAVTPAEGVELEFSYNADCFAPGTVKNLAKHWIKVLTEMCANPDQMVAQIELVSLEERAELLAGTEKSLSEIQFKTIQQLFEEQVEKTPDEWAVTFRGRGLTYRELNQSANRLARVLVKRGVTSNTVVGILSERSLEMVTGVLGVFKAGGAYLPLDPEYPVERLRYMVQDSGLTLLLTQAHLGTLIPFGGEIVTFEEIGFVGSGASSQEGFSPESASTLEQNPVALECMNLSGPYAPTDLAYVIYTSGSTGTPKGVLVQQQNLAHVVDAWRQNYRLDEKPLNVLQMASFAFDVFVADLVKALLSGGHLVICPVEARLEFAALYELIRQYAINLLNVTPSIGLPFIEYVDAHQLAIDSLQIFIVGADACPMKEFRHLVERYGQKMRIINAYGVTEATVDSSTYEEALENLTNREVVPIGKPLPHIRLYVLGRDRELQPIGIAGELYIGGKGVAVGYLNRPELTEERFIPNSFVPGERLYRTGDLARWLPDGNLEFLGRKDAQIKIRGFRIEPGEIEAQIRLLPHVQDVAVIFKGAKTGDGYLCAYLVAEKELNHRELREQLAQTLPEYMLPAQFIQLPQLPLTPNHKVDRRGLAQMEHPVFEGDMQGEPVDEIEARLLQIWSQLLPLPPAGTVDKFMEVGGNSLTMMKLTSLINKEFGTAIKVHTLFRHATIREQAELVRGERDMGRSGVAESLRQHSAADAVANGASQQSLKSAETRAQTDPYSLGRDSDIAIIGMAGRFPEADTLEEFWANLAAGRDSVRELPAGRREELRHLFGQEIQMDFIREGYLEQTGCFEPEIFGMNQEETRYVDPQQRLILELVEEAILDAGYHPEQLARKKTGVLVTANEQEYASYIDPGSIYAHFNAVPASGAGRVAYTYNFTGPALTIDTACSSALVAVHLACQLLRLREMDYAVVGGAHMLIVPPEKSDLPKSPVASLSQQVRAFSEDADGTIGGEGGGVLILKRLREALADGDVIHAVIKGSAVNSDGKRSNGIQAPSEVGQAEVVLQAVESAGIDPTNISYFECHGTGTKIGDPIEIAGLTSALRQLGYEEQSVPIGSVKTNIGHLDTVAGLAGLLKTVLSLKKKAIPPSIHYTVANPLIDFAHSPVFVNQQLTVWKEAFPRRAGVTSLGIIGTNAHVILEEAPLRAELTTRETERLLVTLSARTVDSLQRMIVKLCRFLQNHRDLRIQDVAFTLHTGRRKYPHRMVTLAASLDELIDNLERQQYICYEQGKGERQNVDLVCAQWSLAEQQQIRALITESKELYWGERDWGVLARRVSMPGYEFDRKRYLASGRLTPELLNRLKSKAQVPVGEEKTVLPGVVGSAGIREQVTGLLAGLYSGGQLDERMNWFDVGLSSLAIMHLIGKIQDMYGVQLSVTQFFNDVTVGELIDQLVAVIEEQDVERRADESGIATAGESPTAVSERRANPATGSTVGDSGTGSVHASVGNAEVDGFWTAEGSAGDGGVGSVESSKSPAFERAIANWSAGTGKAQEQAGNQANVRQTIPRQPDREFYTASSAQKRHFIASQLSEANLTYNMPCFLMIEGPLVAERVEGVFQRLIERHEALRSSFVLLEGEIVQRIHTVVDFQLVLTQADETEVPLLIQQFIRPFELSSAPLFRAELVRLPEKHLLMIDMHHIISDGRSVNLITEEFLRLYRGEELPDLRIHYRDFAVWQNELLLTGGLQSQEAFWRDVFADEIAVLQLPADFSRPQVMKYTGARLVCALERELTERLEQLATRSGTTLFMVLLATYNLLLMKYTGQEDIVVGTPVLGRPHPELQNIMGDFVNTLALRNYPQGHKSFTEFLHDVKARALLAYDHQDYPLELLIEHLALPREGNRNPLFDTIFTLEGFGTQGREMGGLHFTPYPFVAPEVKFDLTLTAENVQHHLQFQLEYATELFTQKTIERLCRHWVHLLEQVSAESETTLKTIELITQAEKEQVLYEFNQPVTYRTDETIHQLFEAQAMRMPEQVAVVDGERQLTYQELNERANRLAWTLRRKGVQPDTRVAILTTASLEMFTGILGVLKAGGAYVPVDPEYPLERTRFMLADSGAILLLTHSRFESSFSAAIQPEIIALDDPAVYAIDGSNPASVNTGRDLAYVIYTSGTTGQPKGVMIEHHSLVNLAIWHNHQYAVTQEDHSTKYAGLGFDASVWEIFPYLIAGATIYVVPEDVRLNLQQLHEFYEARGITISFLPTQIAEQFMQSSNRSLRILLTGGDCLRHFTPNGYQLVNNYGPTENTVVTTYFAVERELPNINIPIGRPVANTQVFILNGADQLQPVGVVGELCVGGAGLARGYLNQPQLTADSFTANPWHPAGRMYRTGDLAKWLPDGNIQFAGRKDSQVKIRGVRMELQEIEQQILTIPGIKDTLVLAKTGEDGDTALIAYVIADTEVNYAALRRELAKVLPEAMIPSAVVGLEQFPLTPNGKVDRKALPNPDRSQVTGREYVAPAGDVEERLAQIWAELLQVEQVSTEDNFFELGGHSLKATMLLARMEKEFQVGLPLRQFFAAPTIQECAAAIRQTQKRAYVAIEPAGRRDYYPVSTVQKRLYFLHQLEPESISYNMPGVFSFSGELDLQRLGTALNALVSRHEVLRTSFAIVDGEPVQIVHSTVELPVEQAWVEEEELFSRVSEFIRPFDLHAAPLIRFALFDTGVRQILLFDLPHIIADGQSMEVLVREFGLLYEGKTLPEVKLHYKDFASWQSEYLTSDRLQAHEQFWLERFAGSLPRVNLPVDEPRGVELDFAGQAVTVELDADLVRGVRDFAASAQVTLYMVFLAAYNVLLFKCTGSDDLVVGSPIAGRNHPDLETVVGMFVNTLAHRSRLNHQQSFLDYLHGLKEEVLQAFEHQDYPLERLVEGLKLDRSLSQNPLFEVAFELTDVSNFAEVTLGGVPLTPLEREIDSAKFDLTLYIFLEREKIVGQFVYRTRLFRCATIEDLAQRYLQILKQILLEPEILLAQIQSVAENERRQAMQGLLDDLEDE